MFSLGVRTINAAVSAAQGHTAPASGPCGKQPACSSGAGAAQVADPASSRQAIGGGLPRTGWHRHFVIAAAASADAYIPLFGLDGHSFGEAISESTDETAVRQIHASPPQPSGFTHRSRRRGAQHMATGHVGLEKADISDGIPVPTNTTVLWPLLPPDVAATPPTATHRPLQQVSDVCMEQPSISDILLSLPEEARPPMSQQHGTPDVQQPPTLSAQEAQGTHPCMSQVSPCASGLSAVSTGLVQLARSCSVAAADQWGTVGATLQLLAEQLVQDSVLEQQTPAQVSSILWALGVIHNHATAQVAASSSTGQQDQHAAARQIRHQCLTLAHAMLQHTTALLATSSSTWRSDQLASMLWGLAQLGVQIGHKWMSQYFSASAALLRQGLYTPKALAIELTSMAKVHKHSVQGIDLSAAWQDALLAAMGTPGFWHSAVQQSLANTMWAVAQLGITLPEEVFASWRVAFLKQVVALEHQQHASPTNAQSTGQVSYTAAQQQAHLSQSLHGIATLSLKPPDSWLAAVLKHTAWGLPHASPQSLANIMWSLKVPGLGHTPTAEWMRQFLAAALAAARQLTPQAACNLVRGLTCRTWRPPTSWVISFTDALAPGIRKGRYNAAQLSYLVHCLGLIQHPKRSGLGCSSAFAVAVVAKSGYYLRRWADKHGQVTTVASGNRLRSVYRMRRTKLGLSTRHQRKPSLRLPDQQLSRTRPTFALGSAAGARWTLEPRMPQLHLLERLEARATDGEAQHQEEAHQGQQQGSASATGEQEPQLQAAESTQQTRSRAPAGAAKYRSQPQRSTPHIFTRLLMGMSRCGISPATVVQDVAAGSAQGQDQDGLQQANDRAGQQAGSPAKRQARIWRRWIRSAARALRVALHRLQAWDIGHALPAARALGVRPPPLAEKRALDKLLMRRAGGRIKAVASLLVQYAAYRQVRFRRWCLRAAQLVAQSVSALGASSIAQLGAALPDIAGATRDLEAGPETTWRLAVALSSPVVASKLASMTQQEVAGLLQGLHAAQPLIPVVTASSDEQQAPTASQSMDQPMLTPPLLQLLDALAPLIASLPSLSLLHLTSGLSELTGTHLSPGFLHVPSEAALTVVSVHLTTQGGQPATAPGMLRLSPSVLTALDAAVGSKVSCSRLSGADRVTLLTSLRSLRHMPSRTTALAWVSAVQGSLHSLRPSQLAAAMRCAEELVRVHGLQVTPEWLGAAGAAAQRLLEGPAGAGDPVAVGSLVSAVGTLNALGYQVPNQMSAALSQRVQCLCQLASDTPLALLRALHEARVAQVPAAGAAVGAAGAVLVRQCMAAHPATLFSSIWEASLSAAYEAMSVPVLVQPEPRSSTPVEQEGEAQRAVRARAVAVSAQVAAQAVVDLMGAVARWGVPPTPSWLRESLLQATARAGCFTGAQAAALLRALALMRGTQWTAELQGHLVSLLDAFLPSLLSAPHASTLAEVSWALAALQVRPGPKWWAAFEDATALRLQQLSPPALCELIWAFGALRRSPGYRWMERFAAVVAPQLHKFDGSMLSRLIWSLGAVEEAPGSALLDRFLTESGARLASGAPLSAHSLVLMIGGLSTLGVRPRDAWLQVYTMRLAASLPECRGVHLAKCLSSLAAMDCHPPAPFISACISAAQARLRDLDPGAAAELVWGLERLVATASQQNTQQELSQELGSLMGQMAEAGLLQQADTGAGHHLLGSLGGTRLGLGGGGRDGSLGQSTLGKGRVKPGSGPGKRLQGVPQHEQPSRGASQAVAQRGLKPKRVRSTGKARVGMYVDRASSRKLPATRKGLLKSQKRSDSEDSDGGM